MGEYKKGNTISRGSVTGHIHVHTYILSYHIVDWSIASHHANSYVYIDILSQLRVD